MNIPDADYSEFLTGKHVFDTMMSLGTNSEKFSLRDILW